jgi:hydrogenase-4 component B
MTEQFTAFCVYAAVFFPFIAAIVSVILEKISKKARSLFIISASALEVIISFLLLFSQTETAFTIPYVLIFGLKFELNGFNNIFIIITAIMWFATSLFSNEYFAHYKSTNRFFFFYLLTLGAVCGVFLSADFMTLFVFFEIMSFTSYVWVAHDETNNALKAAETYLAVSVIGGLSILMGMFLIYSEANTLDFNALENFFDDGVNGTTIAAGLCMLAGFGAKAGMFPLHIWLPKAHPVAPAPSSALLSGILTKTGVYGILIITAKIFYRNSFWGSLILTLGVITMIIGALLALLSIDLKRTLACSSMSQIGFILIGTGVFGLGGKGAIIAICGVVLHIINHAMFKLLLFTAAGTVYMNTHKLNLNEIRGFGNNKPFFAVLFSIGSLGISGIPLLGGYVSKTVLHESISELSAATAFPLYVKITEYLFIFAGGLTFSYMIKLFTAIFIDKSSNGITDKRYMSAITATSMLIPSAVIVVSGILGNFYVRYIQDTISSFFGISVSEHSINVFSAEALISALISLVTGLSIYLLVVRRFMIRKVNSDETQYIDLLPEKVDLETMIYRPLISLIIQAMSAVLGLFNILTDTVTAFFFRSGIISRILSVFNSFTDAVVLFFSKTGFIRYFFNIINSVTDYIVLALRKTVFRKSKPKAELNANERASYSIGAFLDRIYAFFNKGVDTRKKTFAQTAVQLRTVNFEVNRMIGKTFSFALIMTCLGICTAIVYILITVF